MAVSRAGYALLGGAIVLAAGLGLYASGALAPLYSTGGYHPNATAADDGCVRPVTASTGATPTSTGATPTPTGGGYDQVTVTVLDAETNATLCSVRAAVADTYAKKYTGLSKTESLPADRGMWFVYDQPGDHTYVMRGMSFGIDIVYVDADGTITEIHHAPEPAPGEDGSAQRYPGHGQYVLEVNYNWTVRHDVTEGDRVVVPET